MKKNNMIKQYPIILVLVIVLLTVLIGILVLAINNNDSKTSDETNDEENEVLEENTPEDLTNSEIGTITVRAFSPDNTDYIKEIIAQAQEEYPEFITEAELVGSNAYYLKVKKTEGLNDLINYLADLGAHDFKISTKTNGLEDYEYREVEVQDFRDFYNLNYSSAEELKDSICADWEEDTSYIGSEQLMYDSCELETTFDGLNVVEMIFRGTGDSVGSNKYQYLIEEDTEGFHTTEYRYSFKCWPRRGHQDWGITYCV